MSIPSTGYQEIPAGLDLAGPDLLDQPVHDVLGATALDREPAAVRAEVVVEGPQRPVEVCGPRSLVDLEQDVVEDEQGADRPGLGCGVEGGMVAQPQVAAEPQDRRGHARSSSRRIDRSNSG